MTLTGQQLARIHKAVLDAYTYDELRRVLMATMNVDIEHLVSPKKAYSDQIFEFVTWADRQGRALELLRCAAEGNERNAGLQVLWAEAKTWDADPPPPPPTSPAVPHHVFLAYSRKDDAVMRQLRTDLLAAGILAWVDQDDLSPGTPVWEDAIETAIQDAQCVVAICTPAAKQAKWFRREISRAEKLSRRIFPVLASGTESSAFPLSLDTEHYTDIRTEYAGSVQNRLIPALRKHLGMAEVARPEQGRDAAPPPKPENRPERSQQPETAAGSPPAPETLERPPWAKPDQKKPTPQVSPPKPIAPKPPIDIEWVTIPAGEFLMGSDKKKDKQAYDAETPQHRLHLPEYCIAKYPITNAQYQVFVKATGYQAPEHWASGVIPKGKENHPVTHVTWEDAQAFCKWAVVRLPSEAEWEKAARGTDGLVWPWGNEAPTEERCNYGMNVGDTTPVGQHPKGASPYGCLDMAGNVWEWTGSLYKSYPYQPDDGREDPNGDDLRTLRGGSWNFNGGFVRCAARLYLYPRLRSGYVGFRVLSPGC